MEEKNYYQLQSRVDFLRDDSWLYDYIIRAYYDARRNKRSTVNQLNFEVDLENNLCALFEDIRSRRYELGPSIAFIVTHPKKREIFAATFRDRIIHHVVYNLIVDYWEKHFIYDSYSCRIGKGTHFGMRRVQHFLRQITRNGTRPAWAMKLDISSYFTSIHQGLMWTLVQRLFTDPRQTLSPEELNLLWYLLPIIIFARPTYRVTVRGREDLWDDLPSYKSLFSVAEDRGFPIGNLTSQLFSNIFLNELDQFAKNTLHLHYYGRYVDDLVILHEDIEYLRHVQSILDDFLQTHLLLQLNTKKTYLQPASYGVPFVGAFIKLDRIIAGPRLRHNFLHFIQQSQFSHADRDWQSRYDSYTGQFSQLDYQYLSLESIL